MPTSMNTQPLRVRKVVPDGGWGWMVVLGTALCNSVCQVLISQYGLIFGERLERMGYNTESIVLGVTVNSVMVSILGLLTAPVVERYPYRHVSIVGSILVSIGLLVCSQATTLAHVVVGFGVITGAGLGILQLATFLVINSYFSERKSIAVGVSLAGTCVGQVLMPHLIRHLLVHYTFQETLGCLAGLSLHGIVGACLFQPVRLHMRAIDNPTEPVSAPLLNPPVVVDKPKRNLFKFQLLLDPIFILILFSLGVLKTINIFFFTIFPLFLRHHNHFDYTRVSTCMSVVALTDTLSRLTWPYVSKKIGFSVRVSFLVCVIAAELSRFGLAIASTYTSIVLCSLALGYSRGGTIVNINISIADYMPANDLASAVGLNMMMGCVVVFFVGQILGWIRDYTHSYLVSVFAVMVCGCVVMLLVAIELILKRVCRHNAKR